MCSAVSVFEALMCFPLVSTNLSCFPCNRILSRASIRSVVVCPVQVRYSVQYSVDYSLMDRSGWDRALLGL